MLPRWKSSRTGKIGAAEAKQLGRELEERIETETRRRLMEMATTFQALEPGWEQRLENGASFVMGAASIRHAIRTVRHSGNAPPPPGPHFQASSLFLKDCRNFLTSDPHGRERLILVSGTISDNGVRVISRIVNVDMDEASPAYVRANPQATHKKIIQLIERDAHPLHAMFHSHIMRGAQSTRPSGVDIANQQRFCAMGWDEVIGGIFSLDGYVRLFSTAHDFTVSLYGNGADIITDNAREKIIKLTGGA